MNLVRVRRGHRRVQSAIKPFLKLAQLPVSALTCLDCIQDGLERHRVVVRVAGILSDDFLGSVLLLKDHNHGLLECLILLFHLEGDLKTTNFGFRIDCQAQIHITATNAHQETLFL